MNNFKRRALIFVTFFGSCLALSLLAASLGTNHWVTAACKRTENAEKSNGTVNFGLFEYETNLNVGYGDRYTVMNMLGEAALLLFGHYVDGEHLPRGYGNIKLGSRLCCYAFHVSFIKHFLTLITKVIK